MRAIRVYLLELDYGYIAERQTEGHTHFLTSVENVKNRCYLYSKTTLNARSESFTSVKKIMII